jgi:hypothetical protein
MLKEYVNHNFLIIDNQITEPAFIEAMRLKQEMIVANRPVKHSSGFFHADEASASALQDTHGTFTSTITAMYDCPKVFRKATKLDGSIEIKNACFNLLAGSTFNYLSTLVDENSVMGGFASRIIYVVNQNRVVRDVKWVEGEEELDPRVEPLFDDLCHIHQLTGALKPTPGFIKRWEEFQPESDRALIDMQSARLESLSARKGVHITKVSMLLAVSESDTKEITEAHWDEAREIVEAAMKDNAFILSQGVMNDRGSQLGTNQVILQALKNKPLPMKILRSIGIKSGHPLDKMNLTIDSMIGSGDIFTNSAGLVELAVDPDRYL